MQSIGARALLALLLAFMIAVAGCTAPDDDDGDDGDVGQDPGNGDDPGADGDSRGTSEDDPARGNVTIDMGEFFYEPEEIWIENGTTVQWMNNGTLLHTATSNGAENESWDTGDVAAGQSAEIDFDTPGTHDYGCTYHMAQGMIATIHVVEREDDGIL